MTFRTEKAEANHLNLNATSTKEASDMRQPIQSRSAIGLGYILRDLCLLGLLLAVPISGKVA
jgi:hypothetical protein